VGSKLCENSDAGLARRRFVSITLNMKRRALAVSADEKGEDSSEHSLLAHVNGPDGHEIRLPLFPRNRTQVGHRAMSVSANGGQNGPISVR